MVELEVGTEQACLRAQSVSWSVIINNFIRKGENNNTDGKTLSTIVSEY